MSYSEFGGQSPCRSFETRDGLPPTGGCQPAREALGVGDPVQILHEFQPNRLGDILGCGVVETETAGDGPHHLPEGLDEASPRISYPLGGAVSNSPWVMASAICFHVTEERVGAASDTRKFRDFQPAPMQMKELAAIGALGCSRNCQSALDARRPMGSIPPPARDAFPPSDPSVATESGTRPTLAMMELAPMLRAPS